MVVTTEVEPRTAQKLFFFLAFDVSFCFFWLLWLFCANVYVFLFQSWYV